MARRRIGQQNFGFSSQNGNARSSSLDELSSLIDWTPVDIALKSIHNAAKGEAAWPPLALFKAMLLSVWYDLSIASASESDDDARWVKHKGKTAVHGFKAHVGADADTALVEEIAVTPANINNGKAGPAALPENPGKVFADSAYRGSHFGNAVRAKGGTPRIVVTGMWGRDETEVQRRLNAWNRPIHRIRGRIEKIFGTWKRTQTQLSDVRS